MEILSFHCQQISSRVDGMQNTHHWSVILTCVTMRLLIRTGGGKIKYYMFSLFKIILHYQSNALSDKAENGQIRFITPAL